MKLFSIIGIAVSILAVAGMLNLGHFRLVYSPWPIKCTNEQGEGE